MEEPKPISSPAPIVFARKSQPVPVVQPEEDAGAKKLKNSPEEGESEVKKLPQPPPLQPAPTQKPAEVVEAKRTKPILKPEPEQDEAKFKRNFTKIPNLQGKEEGLHRKSDEPGADAKKVPPLTVTLEKKAEGRKSRPAAKKGPTTQSPKSVPQRPQTPKSEPRGRGRSAAEKTSEESASTPELMSPEGSGHRSQRKRHLPKWLNENMVVDYEVTGSGSKRSTPSKKSTDSPSSALTTPTTPKTANTNFTQHEKESPSNSNLVKAAVKLIQESKELSESRAENKAAQIQEFPSNATVVPNTKQAKFVSAPTRLSTRTTRGRRRRPAARFRGAEWEASVGVDDSMGETITEEGEGKGEIIVDTRVPNLNENEAPEPIIVTSEAEKAGEMKLTQVNIPESQNPDPVPAAATADETENKAVESSESSAIKSPDEPVPRPPLKRARIRAQPLSAKVPAEVKIPPKKRAPSYAEQPQQRQSKSVGGNGVSDEINEGANQVNGHDSGETNFAGMPRLCVQNGTVVDTAQIAENFDSEESSDDDLDARQSQPYIKDAAIRFLDKKISNRNMLRIRAELMNLKESGNYFRLTKTAPLAAGMLLDMFCQPIPNSEQDSSGPQQSFNKQNSSSGLKGNMK